MLRILNLLTAVNTPHIMQYYHISFVVPDDDDDDDENFDVDEGVITTITP